MPGSIHVSAAQSSAATAPLFLQVVLGKREYNGSIGQGEFSFPVTSLRESMVMLLYNADRSLISQAELKMKAVVESGTMDVDFSLDNGGSIILRLQFLLSDEDRRRVQEMRNSAVKRKQQELLSDGYVLSQDSLLSKQVENISNISREGDESSVRKSMSLDDLQEKAVFSAIIVDPQMKDTKESPEQSGSNSAVQKMISAFQSSSPQSSMVLQDLTRIKSESSLKGLSASSENFTQSSSDKSSSSLATQDVSGHTEAGLVAGTSGKMQLPPGDKSFSNKRSNATEQQAVLSTTSEGRIRRLFREKDLDNSEMVITVQNRSKKRSMPKRRRAAIGPYSLEHMHPHVCITTASRQLRELVELEPPLDSFVFVGQVDIKRPNVRGGASMQDQQGTSDSKTKNEMVSARGDDHGFPILDGRLINQAMRVVIVIIACGAIFLNNR
ncbi:uncharacterized protein [Oryza sativa Japonica Group]|uniref:uncharacterized protein isoform X3 n=1 Tax=Oryza sativa subsp. japonica TaxID=39947 RepID=UPI00339C5700